MGIRVHHEVIDLGQFYGEHDADATRVPGDEPDILFPRRVLWRVTGSADHVIDNLLAIADPGTHRPPHGVG